MRLRAAFFLSLALVNAHCDDLEGDEQPPEDSQEELEELTRTDVCAKFAECIEGFDEDACNNPGDEVCTAACTYDIVNARICLAGISSAPCGTEDEFFVPQLPPECQAVYDCPDETDEDEVCPEDEECADGFDATPGRGRTTAAGNRFTGSDGQSTTTSQGATDQTCIETDVVDAAELPDRVKDCSQAGVTCAAGAGPLQGQVAVVRVLHAGPVPEASTDRSYQYGFVFETDGDPANDYVGIPAFPADFFIGSDLWVEYVLFAPSPWEVRVSEIDTSGNPQSVPASSARVSRLGPELVLTMELDELGGQRDGLSYRASAFCHDGTFLAGNWNGDSTSDAADGLDPL